MVRLPRPTLDITGLDLVTPDGRSIASDIDLSIAPGEHVAILGRSGAGKSTLLEAIAGLRPHAGTVLAGGRELAPLDASAPRLAVAVLAQRPKLFAGTIAANIRIGREGASDAEVADAARRALVTGFASRLPQGLDTPLGEGGLGLSGGEAQRVALARVFLAEPDILLLDEPTSHLDASTEAEVLVQLFAFAQGRTMLIVTHSRVLARLADRRLMLADGALVALDTHDLELVA